MSYLENWLNRNSRRIQIADLGAGMHWSDAIEPAYRALYEKNLCDLILFEPLEEHAQKLRQRFGNRAKVYAHVIGDGKDSNFYECNIGAASACFLPNIPLVKELGWFDEPLRVIKTSHVHTKTLDELCGHEVLDFLKMDIQGMELAVIESSPMVMSKLCVIQTEIDFLELYINQPRFGELDSALVRNGFQIHTFSSIGTYALAPFRLKGPMVHRFHEKAFWPKQVSFSIAAYVRTDFSNFNGDEGSIVCGAAVLHEVYRSYDRAHKLLRERDKLFGGNMAGEYLDYIRREHAAEFENCVLTV